MARDGASAPYLMSDSAKGCPVTAYPFSVSIWWYKGTSIMCLMSFGNSADSAITGLYSNGTTLRIYINNAIVLAPSFNDGWNHLLWVETGSTDHKLYVNGSESSTTNSHTMTAGLNRWGVLRFVDSTPSTPGVAGHPVTDLGVWNVALTATEAADMYNGRLSPLMIRPQSLVAYAPLNDGDGDARDIIGGRHLIETGGSVALVDNPPLRYLRRSFSGFALAAPPPTTAPSFRSLFRGMNF